MRYIGSKVKLLNVLNKEILNFCKVSEGSTFCDMFSGTGIVGENFQNYFKVISNDKLYFSYCLSVAKLCKKDVTFKNLGFNPFDYLNRLDFEQYTNGYCYNTFSPIANRQYFTIQNAKFIDSIRETIEEWYINAKINKLEYDYLIGCLIESVSKIANVAGVYSSYLQNWDRRSLKKMNFNDVESFSNQKYGNIVYNLDSLELIKKIKGDILYLDPPYTITQYISQYHVLETIARNDSPQHHGKGAHRDIGSLSSNWSKKYLAPIELYKLFDSAKFKYIIMSYSDDGIMSKDYIEAVFKRFCGKNHYKFLKINYAKYKCTRTINKENKNHYEWLFLGEKSINRFISPLNYIGGKYDVLDFIFSKIPSKINTFYDLFGGGATVSINANANKIVYNDINYNVSNLLKYISTSDPVDMCEYIYKTINKFKLKKGNKIAYNTFREYYNSKEIKNRHPLDLYILICYGFEHQIRYNSDMKFNNPCGISYFNDVMLEKLISFSLESKKKNLKYYSKDYKCFEKMIKPGDFVYCDPPYLLTCGTYNDGKRGFNGWNEKQQEYLCDFLDRLNQKNIKFALSYVIEHGENKNEKLLKWIKDNKYQLFINDAKTKRNRQERQEALIINYDVKKI